MHIQSLLSFACVFAWTTLVAPASSSTVDCTNIDPNKFFFLSAQYTGKHGNPVAQALQEYSPFHSSRFELRAAGHHDFHETKFKFEKGRLLFVTTGQPAALIYTSQNVTVGQSLGFTAKSKKVNGDLGLIDTDVPHEGDSGCAVMVGKKTQGFTLCDDSIGNPVVTWMGFAKKKDCFDILLVARTTKP